MNNFILFLGKVSSKLEIQYEGSTETQPSSTTNNSGPSHDVLQNAIAKFTRAVSAHQVITTELWTIKRKLMYTFLSLIKNSPSEQLEL